jgi:hypothetical protein
LNLYIYLFANRELGLKTHCLANGDFDSNIFVFGTIDGEIAVYDFKQKSMLCRTKLSKKLVTFFLVNFLSHLENQSLFFLFFFKFINDAVSFLH